MITLIKQQKHFWLLCAITLWLSSPVLGQGHAKLSLMTDLPSAHLYKMLSDSSISMDLQQLKPNIRMGMIDFTEDRLALVKLLDSLNIPMTAWLLLPAEDGKQLSWKASEQAKKRYEELLQWSHENKVNWTGIAMSIVPDQQEQEWLDEKQSRYVERLFSRMYSEDLLLESKRNYQNLIHQMQADGYLVELYAPAYQIDAKKTDSEAPHWVTGVPVLTADRFIPVIEASHEKALASMAVYSTEKAVQEICIADASSDKISAGWEAIAPLVRESKEEVNEVILYLTSPSKTSEFIPNLARFNWEGASSLSSSEVSEVKQRRQKMGRLFDLLRYPKLVLVGLAVFVMLAIVAFIRLLARILS